MIVNQQAFNNLMKELEQYEPKVRNKAVRPAVRTNAKELKEKIKGVVPTDLGNLKKAIIVRATPRRYRGKDTIMSTIGMNKDARVDKNSTKSGHTSNYVALYGYWVHEGTNKMKANPFIKNYIERHRADLYNELIKDVIAGMKGIK